MCVILPTESKQSHAPAEYAGVHSSIVPALSAFSWVCTYMRLTDAMSVS